MLTLHPCGTSQGLVMAAAENGNPDVWQLLLSQKVFTSDKDELEEAVSNGLKVAAGTGAAWPNWCWHRCRAVVFPTDAIVAALPGLVGLALQNQGS